jgi:hypothetical protein
MRLIQYSSLTFHSLFMYIKCQVLLVRFPNGNTITHDPKSVLAAVLKVKVLCSEAGHKLLVVNDASSVHSRHTTVDCTILEPRPAAGRPHGTLEGLLRVFVIFLGRSGLDRNRPRKEKQVSRS